MNRFVVAVTATYRRAADIARLLDSLKNQGPDFGAAIITNNGNDPETTAAFEKSGLAGRCLSPGENLGCGGGLKTAEEAACEQFKEKLTHLWILDDDVEVPPGTLDKMLDAMEKEGADAACSMAEDAEGRLGWFPGLLDEEKFRAIREAKTPVEFTGKCGADPVPFSWSPGVSLLVTRRAIEQTGFHRDNYWVRGEDLEFSLRITHRFKGVFVPDAGVRHFQSAPLGGNKSDAEYVKHCAMLQNICYTSLRLPHGRRIARTIPGNFWRLLKTWPPARALPDAALAFWLGAIRGKPAGIATHFKRRRVSNAVSR